jgi:glycosyltransferase involved in cell wall biosynthesis
MQKFSIITPTHSIKNIPFLLELYESILVQTYTNWEWIIVTNGEMSLEHIPELINQNEKVILYHLDDVENRNIGYAKNKAGELATGDFIVEIDHDDLIVIDCLEKLHNAFENPNIGFCYSNDASYHMEDKFIPYDPAYGWTFDIVKWKDKFLHVMNSFEATSHSLSFIWYSPDHIRAWRKTIYDKIGGFDISMNVCEDHDILVRTYLNTKFYHIKEPLYIYRISGDNNSINHRNAEIQTRTREVFNKYAYSLAEKDAIDKNLLMIDLGGGINGREGYITIDKNNAQIIHDLNEGIPLPDNSVGVVNASHILEHLKDPIKSMSEIYRVLTHGGWAFIEVPSTDGRGAFQDPTHVSFWNENSFMYYTNRNMANFIHNTTIRFCKFRCETFFPNEWMKSINSCVTVAVLVAIKDDTKRFPGFWDI